MDKSQPFALIFGELMLVAPNSGVALPPGNMHIGRTPIAESLAAVEIDRNGTGKVDCFESKKWLMLTIKKSVNYKSGMRLVANFTRSFLRLDVRREHFVNRFTLNHLGYDNVIVCFFDLTVPKPTVLMQCTAFF